MANVIDVVARLRADHSEYMRKMGEATKATRELEGSAKSAGGGIRNGLKVATVGFTALGGAMTAAAGMVGKMGLGVAMANEQAAIGFKVMLGSAEKADAFLKELADFAAKTPFELPDLRTAASRLMSTGVAAERVIPIMTALGDATSAKGLGADAINRAVFALQQMQTAGKATGQDMMQLTQAGIPVWESLAYSMNKTIPEIKKMGEAGQLSVDQIFTAIENYAGPGLQRAKGMMDEQSKTLVGMISTLKDTISQQLGQFMQPVVGAIKNQLPAFTDAIGGALAAISPAIGEMMQGLIPAVSGLLPVLQPLIIAFAGLFTSVVTAGLPILSSFAGVLTQMAPTLSELGPMVGNLISAFTPFVTVIADLALVALPPLIASLSFLTGLLADNKGIMEVLVPVVGGLAAGFVAYKVAVMASNAVTKAKGFFDMAKGMYGAVTALFAQKVATDAATASQVGLNTAMTLNPIGIIIALIVGLIAAVVLMWKKFEWFRRAIKGVWNFIVTAVQKAINVILGYWEWWINKFIDGVNLIIKGWNKIPFHKDVKPLEKVNLQLDIMGATIDNNAAKAEKLAGKLASAADWRKFEGWGGPKKTTTTPTLTPGGAGGGGAGDQIKKAADALKTFATDKLKTARDLLDQLKKKAEAFAQTVKDAIMDAYSFTTALSKMKDSQEAYKTAVDNVAAAEKAVTDALANRDSEGYAKAVKDYADAVAIMNKASGSQMTFMQALEGQAKQAQDFSVLLNRLRTAGLNESGISQILAAGAETGSQIATELLNGGSDAITKANGWYDTLVATSNDTAKAMKDQFYATGISTGEQLVKGIQDAVKNLNLKLKSKGLTEKQIAQLKKNFGVEISFEMESLAGLATPMAKGGIVKATSGGTLALLGEAGRNEAVVPLPSNGIGGTVNQYSITVEAGIGDPQEIGRQLVQVLQAHEKRTGRLPIRTI